MVRNAAVIAGATLSLTVGVGYALCTLGSMGAAARFSSGIDKV